METLESVNAIVAAFTVPENVVPADLEIVIVPSATYPIPDPTAPVTLIVPEIRPVSKVKCRVLAFEIVPPKLIFPLDVVVKTVFDPKVTSSLYICDPVVVTEPPLIAVVPLAFVVKLVKGVDPPIISESVVMPVVLRVKVEAPLTVPPKVISRLSAEIVEFAVKFITCAPVVPKEIAEFVD